MMLIAEARALFLAAVHAVAPTAVTSNMSSARTADDLLDWLSGTDVGALLDHLSVVERDELRLVLDGMLRERAAEPIDVPG